MVDMCTTLNRYGCYTYWHSME